MEHMKDAVQGSDDLRFVKQICKWYPIEKNPSRIPIFVMSDPFGPSNKLVSVAASPLPPTLCTDTLRSLTVSPRRVDDSVTAHCAYGLHIVVTSCVVCMSQWRSLLHT
ncbi:hypothetical protein EVAR_74698_1 [Eumeta japonica]|uniref:Uncharacterized protein n=1 Tax=Eumeta variegata TaxID=151549 RepID=A0A4C1YJ55_EUMVA|nr:hypothetical protein EVAR_74698_1 [Eumeta japonica]